MNVEVKGNKKMTNTKAEHKNSIFSNVFQIKSFSTSSCFLYSISLFYKLQARVTVTVIGFSNFTMSSRAVCKLMIQLLN